MCHSAPSWPCDTFRHRTRCEPKGARAHHSSRPLDLGAFCWRVGNLYGKHGLSPPFELRVTAAAWLADGIELSQCLDMVEQHLRDHAASYRSGSGDRWFFMARQTRMPLVELSSPGPRVRSHQRQITANIKWIRACGKRLRVFGLRLSAPRWRSTNTTPIYLTKFVCGWGLCGETR
jgi:hypothetical protein